MMLFFLGVCSEFYFLVTNLKLATRVVSPEKIHNNDHVTNSLSGVSMLPDSEVLVINRVERNIKTTKNKFQVFGNNCLFNK